MAEAFLDERVVIQAQDASVRTVVREGSLQDLPAYMAEEGLANSRAFVITDTNVNQLYGDAMQQVLGDAGIEPVMLVMEAGEQHKTFGQVGNFLLQLSNAKGTRTEPIITLGGGVVGDLGGFVAASYNRGVPLVHVPTTLLAMVDSSIGGKTGVDHGGKNKVGAIYQPGLVVADPDVLATLDKRVYTEGFGEIAKYAILDARFLPELEEVASTIAEFSIDSLDILSHIIARCVKQKSDVVAADSHEQAAGGRVLLNYGHTLGHGLEAAGNYVELLHGEAVSIGMNFAAQLAVQRGVAAPELVDRQLQLLEALGLPTRYSGDASVSSIMNHIASDKKNTGSDTTNFVLPAAPGSLAVNRIQNEIVRNAVEDFVVG